MDSYNQAIQQSEITTYSGTIGGAAALGNYVAKLYGGSAYNTTLDQFSVDIVSRTLDGIQLSLDRGKGGYLTAEDMHALDYSVWAGKGLASLFPGDRERYLDSLDGFSTLDSFIVQNFFSGNQSAATANLWTTIPTPVAYYVGALASDEGFTPANYGFSPNQTSGLSANGAYTIYTQTTTVQYGTNTLVVHRQVITDANGTIKWVSDGNNGIVWSEIQAAQKAGSIGQLLGAGAAGFIGGFDLYNQRIHAGQSLNQQTDNILNYIGAALGATDIRRASPKVFSGGPLAANLPDPNSLTAVVVTARRVDFQSSTINSAAINIVDSVSNPDGTQFTASIDSVMVYDRTNTNGTAPYTKIYYDPRIQTQAANPSGWQVLGLDGNTYYIDSTGAPFKVSTGGVMTSVYGKTIGYTSSDQAGATYIANLDGSTTVKDTEVTSLSAVNYASDGTVNYQFTSAAGLTIFKPNQTIDLSSFGAQGNVQVTDISSGNNTVTIPGSYNAVTQSKPGDVFKVSNSLVKVPVQAPSIQILGIGDVVDIVSTLGSSIGSEIGRLIGGSNPFAQAAAGTLLGALGAALANDVASGLTSGSLSAALAREGDSIAAHFGEQLPASFATSGISVISSQLSGDLVKALNVKGFWGDYLNADFNYVISSEITIAANTLFHLSLPDPNPLTMLASFLGRELGQLVVSPTTQAGAILGSIGSVVGAVAGMDIGTHFGALGGPVGAVIGAFIGYIIGTLFGNLFGHKKPRIPTASAAVVLQIPAAHYAIGSTAAANGGNLGYVMEIANAAEATLNGIIYTVVGAAGLVANTVSPTQTYGLNGSQLYVTLNGSTTNVADSVTAVDTGVLWALKQTKLMGGSIFAKRAILNSPAMNTTVLMSDLQTASDYLNYQQNRTDTNAAIAASPNSAFTAGWTITFQRANELKLDQWAPSDFYGGLQGFLSSFNLAGIGAHFEDVRTGWDGTNLTISLPGGVSDGPFSILPQANLTAGDLLNPRFQNGLQGWQLSTWNAPGAHEGQDLGSGWSGSGNDSLWVTIPGVTAAGGAIADTRSDWMPSTAGVTYEASVLAAEHRGQASMFIEFYAANKVTLLGVAYAPGEGLSYGSVNGALSSYNRLEAFGVAPVGTVWRREVLRLASWGGTDPYAFFVQPESQASYAGDLANPHFQANLAGWQMYTWNAPVAAEGVNLNSDWSGGGNDSLWVHISGLTSTSGAGADTYSDWMTADAGATYEASVLAAEHRGTSQLFIQFVAADKSTTLGWVAAPGEGMVYGGANGNLANYNRLTAIGVAPAGTVYRRVMLRLSSYGGTDPYAFFVQPESQEVSSSTTTATTWANLLTNPNDLYLQATGRSVSIANIATSIGYQALSPSTLTRTTTDPNSNAAKIYRIYKTAYGRAPDAIGLAVQVNAFSQGMTEATLAGLCLTSAEGVADQQAFAVNVEHVAWTGSLTNAQYVDYLYHTALGRTESAAEQTLQVNALVAGTSRATMLMSFAEGAEQLSDTAAAIAAGVTYGVYGMPAGNNLISAAGSSTPVVFVDTGSGDNILIGGLGNDTLAAGSGNDWLQSGGNGNDLIIGGAGRDVLLGGGGNDTINAGTGDTYIFAGAGGNTITLGAGNDTVAAGAGGDTIWGGTGNATFIAYDDGGANPNVFHGGTGTNTISYERFNEGVTANLTTAVVPPGLSYSYVQNLTGSAYNDVLTSGAGGGYLFGGAGNDVLTGNVGNDTLEGGAGADVMNGGGGVNTLSYASSLAGVTVSFATGIAFGGDATGDVFSNLQNLTGSGNNDNLTGDANANVINAGAGDDWINATAGADTYNGGDGFDTVDYSQTGFVGGSTTINWPGGYVYVSGVGNVYIAPNSYVATIPGVAVTIGANNSGSVTYRAADGSSATQTLTSIEQIIGTASSDTFASSSNSDMTWDGYGGADTITGGTGSDTYLFGPGYGNLTITDTTAASNTIRMKAGITFDQLWAYNNNGALDVGIRGQAGSIAVGTDFAPGNNVIKTLDMNGASQVDLSQITGGNNLTDNADTYTGTGTTHAIIFAYGGNDIINVTGGASTTLGSIVAGGLGNDTITTGAGDDQFLFERGDGVDTITDGGGDNTIVFGPTVAATDVIYNVVGADLYIGIANLTNPAQTADQVADHMRIVGAGVQYNTNGTLSYATNFTTQAGGVTVKLSQLTTLNWLKINLNFSYPIFPVVLDLSGHGLELKPVATSDIVSKDANGILTRIGWVGPDNGILAVDRSGDGKINSIADISFIGDKAGATTDLQGLAGWDTNNDGVINNQDANWGKLLVWTDTNQDGQVEAGEVKTLDQLGVTSLSLAGTPTGFDGSDTIDNVVPDITTFTRADGSSGKAYDVELARQFLPVQGAANAPDVTWSDLSSNGSIGQLKNDPIAAAKAAAQAEIQQTQNLNAIATLNGPLTAALTDQNAQVSFSGSNAPISAADQAIWTNFNAPSPIQDPNALLTDQTTASVGISTLTGRSAPATRLQSLVVDFTGAGPGLIDPTQSPTIADANNTGVGDRIGWVSPSDGLLVVDPSGGSVNIASGVSFFAGHLGAATDMQALAAYDSNGDGVINGADAGASQLMIWRDFNQNGVSDAGELRSLTQAGISQISLNATNVVASDGNTSANQVQGEIQMTMTDGTVLNVYDTALGELQPSLNSSAQTTTSNDTALATAQANDPSSSLQAGATDPLASSSTLSGSSAQGATVATGSAGPVTSSQLGEDGPQGETLSATATTPSSAMPSLWWVNSASGPSLIADGGALVSLDALMQASSAPTDPTAVVSGTPDAATLQRQQLLRQSLAAFQGNGGLGGSTVFTGQASSTGAAALAASTGTNPTLPTATNTSVALAA